MVVELTVGAVESVPTVAAPALLVVRLVRTVHVFSGNFSVVCGLAQMTIDWCVMPANRGVRRRQIACVVPAGRAWPWGSWLQPPG